MKLVSIKDAFPLFSKKIALGERNQQIYDFWRKEVGILGRHSRLLGVKKDCLEVEVYSSVALQEFSLRRDGIIQKLNKRAGEEIIKSINFRLCPNPPVR